MPGLLDKLDPKIATLLLSGGKAIAEYLWRKVAGDDSTDAELAIEAIARRAVQAQLDAAVAELQMLANAAGLDLALDELSDNGARMLAAIEVAAKITPGSTGIPVIGDLDGDGKVDIDITVKEPES